MLEHEQAAFILHTRPYKENQQIVDLFTQEQGKVSALVFVSNSAKSNKKSLLQPFLPLNVVLSGRNNLQRLTQVEASGKSLLLQKERLYSAFYLNELLVRLLPEQSACEALFLQYQHSLLQLKEQDEIELVLRTFETLLLAELGQSIDYSTVFDFDCHQVHYLVEQGFTPAHSSNDLLVYSIDSIKAIAQGDLSLATTRQTYKYLMRQIINHLLNGKPLNSRKLFK